MNQHILDTATLDDVVPSGDCTCTNRVTNDNTQEWVETGRVNGIPVRIVYNVPANTGDGMVDSDEVDWHAAFDHIEVDLVRCDRDDIDEASIDGLVRAFASAKVRS